MARVNPTDPLESIDIRERTLPRTKIGKVKQTLFNLGEDYEDPRVQFKYYRNMAARYGDGFIISRRQSGNLWSWGCSAEEGQLGLNTLSPTATPTIIDAGDVEFSRVFATGRAHTVALDVSGAPYTWGDNQYGQLGDNTTTGKSSPISVVNNILGRAVAAGWGHSLVIDQTDNIAWAWGLNNYGQLGDGTTTNKSSPVSIALGIGRRFRKIDAGDEHSIALDQRGQIWAWGNNQYGQVGGSDGGLLYPMSTVESAADLFESDGVWSQKFGLSYWVCGINCTWDGVKYVSGGGLSLNSTGTWMNGYRPDKIRVTYGNPIGASVLGQLRDTTPFPIAFLTNDIGLTTYNYGETNISFSGLDIQDITSISRDVTNIEFYERGSDYYELVNNWGAANVDDDYFYYEQDPFRANTPYVMLEIVPTAGPITEMKIKIRARTDNPPNTANIDVYLWDNDTFTLYGSDSVTILGDGLWNEYEVTFSPLNIDLGSIGTLSCIIDVPSPTGDFSISAVAFEPTPESTSITDPTSVDTITTSAARFIEVAAGSQSSYGIDTLGTVYSWGDNSYGQLGDGTTTDKSAPVSVSGRHSFIQVTGGGRISEGHACALKPDGSVWCFGRNHHGQLGLCDYTDRSTPTLVVGNHSFIDIWASKDGYQTIAIKLDGSVWVWGKEPFCDGVDYCSPVSVPDFNLITLNILGRGYFQNHSNLLRFS